MKLIYLVVLLSVSSIFAGCQKELGFSGPIDTGGTDSTVTPPVNNTADIKGNWKFLFLKVDLRSITEYSGVKGVAGYSTTTVNNSGNIKIDASTMKGTDFAYTIDTEVFFDTYIGNEKMDSMTQPLKYTAAKYNFQSDYTQIGSDSVYMPSGFILNTPDPNSASIQNPPSGAKFRIQSDTLILTTTSNMEQTVSQTGENITIGQNVNATIYLKRQ